MKAKTTAHEQLIVQLLKTGQQLQASLDQLFKAHGLSRQQYNVLRILRGAEEHTLSVIELRDRLIETQSDITRLLERLIQKNLITKEQAPEDKRKWLVHLEESGLRICIDLDETVSQWNQNTFHCFNEKEIEQLLQLSFKFNQFHQKEPTS